MRIGCLVSSLLFPLREIIRPAGASRNAHSFVSTRLMKLQPPASQVIFLEEILFLLLTYILLSLFCPYLVLHSTFSFFYQSFDRPSYSFFAPPPNFAFPRDCGKLRENLFRRYLFEHFSQMTVDTGKRGYCAVQEAARANQVMPQKNQFFSFHIGVNFILN